MAHKNFSTLPIVALVLVVFLSGCTMYSKSSITQQINEDGSSILFINSTAQFTENTSSHNETYALKSAALDVAAIKKIMISFICKAINSTNGVECSKEDDTLAVAVPVNEGFNSSTSVDWLAGKKTMYVSIKKVALPFKQMPSTKVFGLLDEAVNSVNETGAVTCSDCTNLDALGQYKYRVYFNSTSFSNLYKISDVSYYACAGTSQEIPQELIVSKYNSSLEVKTALENAGFKLFPIESHQQGLSEQYVDIDCGKPPFSVIIVAHKSLSINSHTFSDGSYSFIRVHLGTPKDDAKSYIKEAIQVLASSSANGTIAPLLYNYLYLASSGQIPLKGLNKDILNFENNTVYGLSPANFSLKVKRYGLYGYGFVYDLAYTVLLPEGYRIISANSGSSNITDFAYGNSLTLTQDDLHFLEPAPLSIRAEKEIYPSYLVPALALLILAALLYFIVFRK